MSFLVDFDDVPPLDVWGPAVRARSINGERVTLALVELAPDAPVPEHRHENEQMGMVITGTMTFTVDGETRTLGPGGTWRIPPNRPHHAVAGPEGAVVVDLFAPLRTDWDERPHLDPRPASRQAGRARDADSDDTPEEQLLTPFTEPSTPAGGRVRRVAAVHRDRGLVRRPDAAAARRALLSPGGRGAQPRDDHRPVPARRPGAGRHPGCRGPRTDFADPIEPVRLALEQEKHVTDQIEALAGWRAARATSSASSSWPGSCASSARRWPAWPTCCDGRTRRRDQHPARGGLPRADRRSATARLAPSDGRHRLEAGAARLGAMSRRSETYTHGHHESVLRSHRWRTAENSAAYLLPHLAPGPRPARRRLRARAPSRSTSPRGSRRAGWSASTPSSEPLVAARADAADAGVGNVSFEVGDAYALAFDDAIVRRRPRPPGAPARRRSGRGAAGDAPGAAGRAGSSRPGTATTPR